jgi:hypothetical protein
MVLINKGNLLIFDYFMASADKYKGMMNGL